MKGYASKVLSIVKNKVQTFLQDVLDQGAQHSSQKASSQDYFKGLGAAMAVVASAIEDVQKVFSRLLGLSEGSLSLILSLCALIGCWYIFTSKVKAPSSDSPILVHYYSFNWFVRQLSKVVLVVLLLFSIPRNTIELLEGQQRLPKMLTGRLEYARTRQPVVNANVRIITEDGRDVTKNSWASDHNGFYIVETSQRVLRSAKLLVYVSNCESRELPLLKEYENTTESEGNDFETNQPPIFYHLFDCNLER